jgi:hypothetical protein
MSGFVEQGLPPLETTEYAIEGSKGHAVADPVLRFKLGLSPELNTNGMDLEMLRHAESYANHIVDLLKPFTDNPDAYRVDSWVEKKLTYKEGLLGGTCDYVGVVQNLVTKKNYAYIIDYKYGRGIPVDSKDNWQLLSYAMCLNKMLASLDESVYIDNFILGIYQPRGKDGDNETPYNEVEYTIEEISPKWDVLIETLDIVSSAISNMDTTHLVTKAGSWCHFCKAREICDVKNEKKQEKIKELYTSFIDLNPMIVEKGKKKVNKINLEFLSLDDLAYLALNRTKLVSFIEGASEFATGLMLQGTKIPNCKLIEATKTRKFIDDKEALVKGLVELGVEKPVETIEKVITLTEAEKLVGKGKLDHLLLDRSSEKPTYKLVDESSKGDEITINDDERIESLYASIF